MQIGQRYLFMRINYVELIMAVEEGFQIHISDGEASRLESAGDLYNLVSAK